MLNPLLHSSNSAPSSPIFPRAASASSRFQVQQMPPTHQQPHGMVSITFSAPPGHLHHPPHPPHHHRPEYRRLSRVVKCRTLDFTEFPEGMREYGPKTLHYKFNNLVHRSSGASNASNSPQQGKGKLAVSRSQPGSPVSVPKITVQDFGNGFMLGSEVKKSRLTSLQNNHSCRTKPRARGKKRDLVSQRQTNSSQFSEKKKNNNIINRLLVWLSCECNFLDEHSINFAISGGGKSFVGGKEKNNSSSSCFSSSVKIKLCKKESSSNSSKHHPHFSLYV